jgi:hypothetical protein
VELQSTVSAGKLPELGPAGSSEATGESNPPTPR